MDLNLILGAATGGGDKLLLSLFLLFAAAKLAAEIFERLRQPAVVGEILAGVVVGPSVLGWVAPSEVTSALAEIGAILLLFTVGLEVRPAALMKVGVMATIVAVSGVVLPFLAGWALMAAWGAPRIEGIFVGAAMVATSVGITARVLAGLNALQAKSSQIILGAAVIDDILGLLILSVVASLAAGEVQYGEVTFTAVLSIAFTLFMLFVGSTLALKARPVIGRLRIGNAFFVLALVLCLGLSYLGTEIKMAPIIGAFLAGMALADVSEGSGLHHEVGSVMEFLVPFFLAGIGLQLKLSVFTDPSVLTLAGLVTIIAVITKLVGCGVVALPLGMRQALQIGVGMVPRGEVGIIVAQLGLVIGVLTDQLYAVVVFMAVATTLVAPPLLALVFAKSAGESAPDERAAEGEEVVEADQPLSGLD
jgi:Kef-type K+ transport system membrane component KefB